jgi:membrane protease YdiL (CAAX protease family)
VFLLESALLALLIGPAVAAVLGTVGLRSGPVDGATSGTEHVLLSIGAGVYEELVFRFLLLAGGFVLLHRGFALGRKTSFAVATGISALLFAAYHHVGPYGEPYGPAVFAFRAAAGVILGLLLAGRGLALCAYLHAFYDILCDLGRSAETP